MKHATNVGLDRIEDVLAAVREHTELKERGRGVFYRKASAFLHFHEDPAGLFADLKTGTDWQRFPVNSAAERSKLLNAVRRAVQ